MLDMSRLAFYPIGMTQLFKPRLWCRATRQDFPILATVVGVAGLFGDALVSKYFGPGRAVQIMLALGEAIPMGLLTRYFIAQARKPNQGLDDRTARVHRTFS